MTRGKIFLSIRSCLFTRQTTSRAGSYSDFLLPFPLHRFSQFSFAPLFVSPCLFLNNERTRAGTKYPRRAEMFFNDSQNFSTEKDVSFPSGSNGNGNRTAISSRRVESSREGTAWASAPRKALVQTSGESQRRRNWTWSVPSNVSAIIFSDPARAIDSRYVRITQFVDGFVGSNNDLVVSKRTSWIFFVDLPSFGWYERKLGRNSGHFCYLLNEIKHTQDQKLLYFK